MSPTSTAASASPRSSPSPRWRRGPPPATRPPSPATTTRLATARGLEGIVPNHSIHGAAVVIADRPLQEIVPLQLAEDRGAGNGNGNGSGKTERAYKTVTQYSMGPIEEIGLLKMDFLGLRN